MNKYEERLKKLANHVASHPSDYQSAISLLIMQSNQIDYEIKQRQIATRKMIEGYKEEARKNGEQV